MCYRAAAPGRGFPQTPATHSIPHSGVRLSSVCVREVQRKPGTVAHISNPSSIEGEAGGWQVKGLTGRQGESLSQNTNTGHSGAQASLLASAPYWFFLQWPTLLFPPPCRGVDISPMVPLKGSLTESLCAHTGKLYVSRCPPQPPIKPHWENVFQVTSMAGRAWAGLEQSPDGSLGLLLQPTSEEQLK